MATANQDKPVEVKVTDQPTDTRGVEPVIIDLGKQKKKNIRRLRKGRGRLFGKVVDAHEQLRDQGLDSGPVIVVVKQKNKKKRGLGGSIW